MVVRIPNGAITLIGLNPNEEEKRKTEVCGNAWERSLSNRGLGTETLCKADEDEEERSYKRLSLLLYLEYDSCIVMSKH